VLSEFVDRATGKVDATALVAAETAIGLWERCLASATVEPMNNRLAGITPAFMALVGRILAAIGNLVCKIAVQGTRVMLTPASTWDAFGLADPETWTYRLDLVWPSSTESVGLPGAAVLHFRTGADSFQPWRGVARLRRSSGTAALAAAVELSLSKEARLPTGRLSVSYGESRAASVLDFLRRGGYAVVGGVDRGVQPEPAARHALQPYGPKPEAVMERCEAIPPGTSWEPWGSAGVVRVEE